MTRVRALMQLTVLVAILASCGKQTRGSHLLVILVDVSDSIEPAAEEQAFAAIDRAIAEEKRGDEVAVIPITGDAQAETSGRVMRFRVPTVRQAYDNDLRQFRNTLKRSLGELKAEAMANPGKHTDLLGAVMLAQQEFRFHLGQSKRFLAVLSDFLQDDGELDFVKDRRLGNTAAARELAIETANTSSGALRGMKVYLGMLRSKDYKGLNRSRRDAIQEFWTQYFNYSGAHTTFATDGTGLLGQFLNAE